MEDITDPEEIRTDPECKRKVTLYGYVRGTSLKQNGIVHIPGTVLELSFIPVFDTFIDWLIGYTRYRK